MKTALFTSVLIIIFFSCSHHIETIPKDCEGLKAQGIIDSFPYPVRPESLEWQKLKTSTEKYAVVNVPEDMVKSMCTYGLIYTCLYCPMLPDMFAYNIYSDGFHSLINKINSFSELTTRDDAGKELFDYYMKLTDTTLNNITTDKYQYQIYLTEIVFSQEEFLTKFDDPDLKEVLLKAYENLKIKEKFKMNFSVVNSNLHLTTSILYYNIRYQPLINCINNNNLINFLYNAFVFKEQSTDSLRYFTQKYIQDNLK
jgi:hypothetical protein